MAASSGGLTPLVGGRQLRSAFLFAGFHFAVTPVLFWTLETFKVSEDAHNRTGQLNSTLPPLRHMLLETVTA